ncbi:MAG: TIR domain-containing protein [Methylomicrobium sp.]
MKSEQTNYRLIQLLGHQYNNFNEVAFSPNGQWIAGAGSDSLILVWDADNGELLNTLEGHQHSVLSIAFSPDGQWLASCSFDLTVRLWEAATGKLVRILEGHEDYVYSIAFSPDGHWLASSADDGTVRLWEAATGKLVRILEGHEGSVNNIAFSPDGYWLASSGSDSTVRLWEAATGKLVRILEGQEDWLSNIAFSPDGHWLASSDDDGTVRLWEAATGNLLLCALEGHASTVHSFAFSPDGQWLTSVAGDDTVRLWEAATGKLVRILEGHEDWLSSIVFSPDGHWLAGCSERGLVQLWETATGKLLRSLKGHQDHVSDIAFTPDEQRLASSADDGTVRLWEAATGKLVRILEGHEGSVNNIAFSPDGYWLAGCTHGGLVQLWEAATGKLVRILEGHEVWATSIAFSPDGHWLASSDDDGTVRLWEAATGKLVRFLEGHEGSVNNIAFSPDGYWLAGCTHGGLVQLWEAATGKLLRKLGQGGPVRNIAFSPDGRWLACGAEDRTMMLWEAASGELIDVQKQHYPAKFQLLGFLFAQTLIFAEPFHNNSIWLQEVGSATPKSAHDVINSSALSTRITSAKIVLLGESQVGKSALALRLAEDRYEDQATTHGMRIWKLSPEKLDPNTAKTPEGENREVVLWDLGGQEEYRLIHQLFIHDTELALMLLDPTRGYSAFDDVREWNARLESQRKTISTTKLLVGSKLDDGGANIDCVAVEKLLTDCDAVAFLPTSAKTEFGIDNLRKELSSRIDWYALAETRRPVLFQRVVDEVDRLQQQGEVTLALTDLRETIKRADPDEFDTKAVDQVVDQLARQGVVADTRLASGERVLILQLGEIERYAGSLVYAAKENLRTRGIPILDERDIAHSDAEFPRIPRYERLLPSRERVVLECVIQLLIERGICLRQPGVLIFPSLFPIDEEGPVVGADSISLYYDFTGPIDNLYAGLIAQAALSQRFGRVRISSGRAEFEHAENGLCGLRRKAQNSGRGHLDIFFSAQASLETKQLFRRFVEDFLQKNGVNVTEAVQIACMDCGHLFAEDDVRKVIEADRNSISCPLGHATEVDGAVLRSRKVSPGVDSALIALKTDIENGLKRAATDAKRAIGRVRIFVSYSHADDGLRTELSKHLSVLKHEGVVELWDDRHIGPGDDWESAIDARLDRAQIVLLLISADFMNSSYCRKEADRALKRRKAGETTVIPVVLRPIDWTSSNLAQLQALPKDGKPIVTWPNQDEGLLAVAKGVRKAAEALLRKPTEQEVIKAGEASEVVISTPKRPVRILHLSDLHFGAKVDPIEMFQPLAQDIRDPEGELGFSELDYLVISGDLTQRGLPSEFERVHRFLEKLMESFGLSPERTLIVPGNHDLCWDTEVYDWVQARKVDATTLPTGSWRKEGNGFLIRNDASYGKRFENFARFFNERTHQMYPLEPENQGFSLLAERDRIQFVGLNSAWEIDEYFKDRSGIHPGALARILARADKQIEDAAGDRGLITKEGLLRIAVWHHPPTGNDKIYQDAFIERLLTSNITLCLHGHVHENRTDIIRYTYPRKLYTAGAGSFGTVASDRPESTPRLYNLLEIAPNRSHITVHTRCMHKSGGAWEGWAVWPSDKKGERRTYYEIPLG